ncbi:TPA: hypothetical protein DCX15_01355 [bacterium]|nr:hypothetical protein [bacterium]
MGEDKIFFKKALKITRLILGVSIVGYCALFTITMFFISSSSWNIMKPIGWIAPCIILLLMNILLFIYLLKIRFLKATLIVLVLIPLIISYSYVVFVNLIAVSDTYHYTNWGQSTISEIIFMLQCLLPPIIVLSMMELYPIRLISGFDWKGSFLNGCLINLISYLCIFILLSCQLYNGSRKICLNSNNPSVLIKVARDDWFLVNRISAIRWLINQKEGIQTLKELLRDDEIEIRSWNAWEILKKIEGKR